MPLVFLIRRRCVHVAKDTVSAQTGKDGRMNVPHQTLVVKVPRQRGISQVCGMERVEGLPMLEGRRDSQIHY